MTPGDAAFRNASARRGGGRRGLHVLHVRLRRLQAAHADLADAARPLVLRRRAALREPLEDARKLDQVLPRLARRVAGEAGEAILDVRGVADLAHLAVAHHVDAGFDLSAHDFAHGVGDRRVRGGCVGRVAAVAREQHVRHGLRARQAADVRDENPLACWPSSAFLAASAIHVVGVWSPASQRLSSACASARRVALIFSTSG